MWIFTSVGFISVVRSDLDSEKLAVRARKRKHLEMLLPDEEIVHLPNRDYKYRVFITQEKFTDLMLKLSTSINYQNFKSSVHEFNYQDACHEVWGVMNRYQRGAEEPVPCEVCGAMFYLDVDPIQGMETGIFGRRCWHCLSGVPRPPQQLHGFILKP
ncbi:hypothetical protein KP004_06835 [Geomonas oryzisoli]|uniref:Uncharacterized protein n=1 Tax=Geomonas oryzisoli TaxID=2847992 RepID=A0ABX8JDX7_9BACT|nr:hypothetical protein [Geomonas oryzisoli]QWV94887.1 hypothetical protein KP004_06835 [Geomonas oryzisoli]